MTERPYDPAEPGRVAGRRSAGPGHRARPSRHRRAAARQPGRRPPGRAVAAVLSLVLGVSTAMLLTARYGGPAAEVGAPASIAELADVGTRPPADRAARGEPRTPPDSAATPTAPGRPAAPARTLVPAPSTARATAEPTGTGERTGTGGRTGPAGATPDTSVTAEVVRLTNLERATAGCAALHVDQRLTAAAQGHSADMATRNYFAHDTPEGKTPWDRAKAAGYADPSAENIAMGYRTPADVVTGWMNSPGHRANILNCASHAIGIGYDQRGFYWTQLFGFV